MEYPELQASLGGSTCTSNQKFASVFRLTMQGLQGNYT